MKLTQHHANATCHHSTPHLIRRLQQAITPGMTDIPKTPSVVINIGSNQTSEAQEQSEETPPSPPEPEQTDATKTLEQESVDLSAIESDPTQSIANLRRALALVEDEKNIAIDEEQLTTHSPPARERKGISTSPKHTIQRTKRKKEKVKKRTEKFKAQLKTQTIPTTQWRRRSFLPIKQLVLIHIIG
jgi:hypothetical protein